MNKRIACILTTALLFGFLAPCLAQTPAQKGASEKAIENAGDEAVFNRVSDWFATIGKNDEEKQAVLAERKAKRASEKAKKEAEKLQKEAEKEAEKAGKTVQEKQKEMRQGAEKQTTQTKKFFHGKHAAPRM